MTQLSGFKLAFVASLLLVPACGGPLKYEVPSSNIAPGADAHVVADVREDQKQTLLEVTAVNLPPPARVNESAATYVAWYRKDGGQQWARIGNLAYEESDREATLAGSVPELAFDLEITAEPQVVPVAPSSTVLFSQRVQK